MSTEPTTLRLRPEPTAAGDARRFVRTQCAVVDADACERACLLTSELVTNAVIHGRTMITVAVAVDREGGRICVAIRDDNSEEVPAFPTVPDPMSQSGRGLAIVDALAGDCGVVRRDAGKTVWFRVP